MKSYITKWKKIIIFLMVAIIAGGGIMIAVAGVHYIKAGNNKGKHIVETENIKTKKNNAKKVITIKIPRQYVNKFVFEYESADFSNLQVEVDKTNIYGVVENIKIQDKFMEGLPRSVVNVNGKISKIKLSYVDQETPVKIYGYSIDNSFKINPLLGVFWMAVIFLLLFLIGFRKENAEHEGIVIFVCAFVSSTCLLILMPYYINGWDEQIHYTNAYELGVTKTGEHATRAQDYVYNNASKINEVSFSANETVEERLDMVRLMGERQLEQGGMSKYIIRMHMN